MSRKSARARFFVRAPRSRLGDATLDPLGDVGGLWAARLWRDDGVPRARIAGITRTPSDAVARFLIVRRRMASYPVCVMGHARPFHRPDFRLPPAIPEPMRPVNLMHRCSGATLSSRLSERISLERHDAPTPEQLGGQLLVRPGVHQGHLPFRRADQDRVAVG